MMTTLNQSQLQPQQPHSKTAPVKSHKDIPLNNNIDYTIMDERSKVALDFLLSSEQGEILKRNGQELKKLKIGEKTYNFDRNKPLTQRLKTKLNKVRQTMDYKKYELKEKRDIKWVNLDKNKTLRTKP